MIGAFQYLNSMHLANTQAMLVQELLKNPNCRLEELLDEDGLVQEFKEGKSAVMAFFDAAKLDRLLEFVLVDSEAPDDRKSSYKFPSVAAELLSAPIPKTLDYFLQRRDERLLNFEHLLSPLYDAVTQRHRVEQNLTRLGYVQKVVMALIGARPLVFLPYLLADQEIVQGIVANCHSKSMHGVLLLMLLGQSALQATSLNDQAAKELETLRVKTRTARDKLLGTLLKACLASDLGPDTHINLCGLVSTLFPRDFVDKQGFLFLFKNSFFPLYVADFKANFTDGQSRAYSVLFSFVEAACKESFEKSTLLPPKEEAALVADMMALVVQSLCAGQPRQSAGDHQVQTSSYGRELHKTNSKLVKLIDVLRFAFFEHLNSNGVECALHSPEFAGALVTLMTSYPQNNILHNQILKFWLMMLTINNSDVFDFFFVDCVEFCDLLTATAQNAVENLSSAKNPARNGFLGHLKVFYDGVLKTQFAAEATKLPHFALFEEKFYASEKAVETYCLGDVDVGQVDVEAETNFGFTVDEFQRKYAVFIGEDEDQTADSEPEGVGSEEGSGEQRHSQRISSHDLDEDVKNLDVMTVEEETAFFDSNYWKPVIDYDIEKLTLEMGFSAL